MKEAGNFRLFFQVLNLTRAKALLPDRHGHLIPLGVIPVNHPCNQLIVNSPQAQLLLYARWSVAPGSTLTDKNFRESFIALVSRSLQGR